MYSEFETLGGAADMKNLTTTEADRRWEDLNWGMSNAVP